MSLMEALELQLYIALVRISSGGTSGDMNRSLKM
jgi:hypothetical protein